MTPPAPSVSILPDPALDVLVEAGRKLWREGKRAEAAIVMTDAFDQGLRDRGFLDDYAEVLSGLARYTDLLQRWTDLTAEGLAPSPQAGEQVAHAKLALRYNRVRQIALAAEREDSRSWASPDQLVVELTRACRAGRPFSFIRLDEDDARFLVAVEPVLHAPLNPDEARFIGDRVWTRTFGGPLSAEAADDLEDFARAYTVSIDNADILGVADARRIGEDNNCYGYLAAQADRIDRSRGADGLARRFTDARNASELNRLSPYLARMLQGLPFLGVVSAYPGLAERLSAHLAISRHASYDAPTGDEFATERDVSQERLGFPDDHIRLVDTIETPFPGAVFLVAAGLPGKIYCDRIKQLGGVAIDIGDLADIWMHRAPDPGAFASNSGDPSPSAGGEDWSRMPGRQAWA